MNADGIYLATYAALLLNLKLINCGHYDETNTEVRNRKIKFPIFFYFLLQSIVPMAEIQFVEEIHGSGVLVYISATWLCELYQNVLAKSLLQIAGYDPKSFQHPALINLLTGNHYILLFLLHSNVFGCADVGGLCSSQMLTDWQKLQKVRGTPETSPEVEAGIKLSRRVFTCCWSSVVSVLGLPLGDKAAISGTASALSRLVARRARQKMRQRMRDEIVTASLEALHKV